MDQDPSSLVLGVTTGLARENSGVRVNGAAGPSSSSSSSSPFQSALSLRRTSSFFPSSNGTGNGGGNGTQGGIIGVGVGLMPSAGASLPTSASASENSCNQTDIFMLLPNLSGLNSSNSNVNANGFGSNQHHQFPSLTVKRHNSSPLIGALLSQISTTSLSKFFNSTVSVVSVSGNGNSSSAPGTANASGNVSSGSRLTSQVSTPSQNNIIEFGMDLNTSIKNLNLTSTPPQMGVSNNNNGDSHNLFGMHSPSAPYLSMGSIWNEHGPFSDGPLSHLTGSLSKTKLGKLNEEENDDDFRLITPILTNDFEEFNEPPMSSGSRSSVSYLQFTPLTASSSTATTPKSRYHNIYSSKVINTPSFVPRQLHQQQTFFSDAATNTSTASTTPRLSTISLPDEHLVGNSVLQPFMDDEPFNPHHHSEFGSLVSDIAPPSTALKFHSTPNTGTHRTIEEQLQHIDEKAGRIFQREQQQNNALRIRNNQGSTSLSSSSSTSGIFAEDSIRVRLPVSTTTVKNSRLFTEKIISNPFKSYKEDYCSTFYKRNRHGYMFVREPTNILKVNTTMSKLWVQLKIKLTDKHNGEVVCKKLKVDVKELPIWKPITGGGGSGSGGYSGQSSGSGGGNMKRLRRLGPPKNGFGGRGGKQGGARSRARGGSNSGGNPRG